MISTFKKHIEQEFSFFKGKRLLVTVSGGIDSTILTHLLHSLNYSISIAHCNFNLRGKESDTDADFVESLAAQLKVPFFTTLFKTEKIAKERSISIQMAARELRYEWFEEIRKKENIDYILTAHNKDDILETFLINFTRGTGLSGLTGIPTTNGKIIRPLLKFTRSEINEYAKENNIQWREDSSNASTKYLRNKLRHDVIPVLKELNPSLMSTLDNTLDNLKGSNQIVKDAIDKIKSEVISEKDGITLLNINKLKVLNAPKTYLFELLKSYGFSEWNDVSDLINAQSGKQLFSNTHRLIKDREFLLLSRINNSDESTSFKMNDFNILKTKQFEISFTENSDSKNNESITVDTSKLVLPLSLRKWKHGDVFYPSGMTGKKKVGKYFKDEKLSLLAKEGTWILENGDHQIIWIVGQRADRRFETSETTTDKLQISFNNNN